MRTWIGETIAALGGEAPCNSTSGKERLSGSNLGINLFTAWNSTATWGGWGSWSECSQSCDGGSARRERQCLYHDGVVAASSQLCGRCQADDISCSDGSVEYERCNEGVCSGTTGMYKCFPNEICCLPHSFGLESFLSISQSVSLGEFKSSDCPVEHRERVLQQKIKTEKGKDEVSINYWNVTCNAFSRSGL